MMQENRFGHLDLRVGDMKAALAFYSQLLPALGFGQYHQGGDWSVFRSEGKYPSRPWVALTEQPAHGPNENRISFWAKSRQEVDRLSALVRSAGGVIESGPRECLDYSPTYYAVFFEDPSGNKLEICFRED